MTGKTGKGTVDMKLFSTQKRLAAPPSCATRSTPQPISGQHQRLTSRIRNACAQAGIQLAYEPLIHLPSGQLWGVEVRVLKPTEQGQLINLRADELISHAETSGYVLPMGYWALETALSELQPWFTQCPQGQILIHLRPGQMASPHLEATVQHLCQQYALCPSRLKLQMREPGLQVHGPKIWRQLQRKPFEQLQLVIDSFDCSGADFSWLNSGLIQGVKVTPPRQPQPHQSLYTQQMKTLMVFKNLMGIDIIGCDIHNAVELQQLRELGCDIGMGPALASAVDSHTLIHALPRTIQPHETPHETHTH